MKKSKSLLIIGGTGFFGKSFLDSFKRGLLEDYGISQIIVLSRSIEKFKLNYPELVFGGVEFLIGDISNLESLPETDYIIHAASSTNMADYDKQSLNAGKINIENSVVNFCRIASKSELKSKILYCSSGAVYGKQPVELENISEDFPFNENLSDLSIEKQNYCQGKRFAESKIIELGKSGSNVSIARCFAFSGKYLPKDQHFAYGNFVSQAEKGEKILVKTNGVVYRSYMDADDLVISLMNILLVSSYACPIYNVGSDKSIAIHDLAAYIAKKYNVDFQFDITEMNKVIDRYVPNIYKLKMLLNKTELSCFIS